MRINLPGGGHVTIDDSDERIQKIRRGHKPDFINGELVVSDQSTELDVESLLVKLSDKRASILDLQEAVSFLLKKYLENGII